MKPRAATVARLARASLRPSNDQGAALRVSVARPARCYPTRGDAAQPHLPCLACVCAPCLYAFSTPFAEVFK